MVPYAQSKDHHPRPVVEWAISSRWPRQARWEASPHATALHHLRGNALDAQKGSNTRPHSGLHWSAAVGIHPGGHAPAAQPLRQASLVVIPCSLPKTSAMVHSCAWTAFGGAPPICAAACALAPPKNASTHEATAATLTVVIGRGRGGGGALKLNRGAPSLQRSGAPPGRPARHAGTHHRLPSPGTAAAGVWPYSRVLVLLVQYSEYRY